MTEITHHEIDDGFHEIQLSGKQLVFLFMATTIVAVVIFLCGVQVGRNVRTVRVAETGDPMTPATSSSASIATPPATPAASEPQAVEPPAPAQEVDTPLTYGERLQSDKAPKEQLKPRDESAPAPAQPVASAPAKTTAPPAPQPSTPAANPPASRSGAWVIQVNALTNRAAADAMARRLSGKGYPAFVLAPASGAPAVYRVQIGRYTDRREAEQVARRLEKEEQLKPWVQH